MTSRTSSTPTDDIGTFCLVLHSHLPWVAHHGTWPVGEEWLHQAWADSYARVLAVAQRLGSQGREHLFTLGVTPVLAAALDDSYCISEHHRWLADRHLRATGLATDADPVRRHAAPREIHNAGRAMQVFEKHWSRGASPVLRDLTDAHAIELLGGPLSHTFTPYLPDNLAAASLQAGLDDAELRIGQRPVGIWTPECAFRPGMETTWSDTGISHLMLEGPTLQSAGAHLGAPWHVGDSNVAVFGRDLTTTYRVWSPRRGYPGNRWYRDFHTFDHNWGLRLKRVTGQRVTPENKAPYDPERAAMAVRADAVDFVGHVRKQLLNHSDYNNGQRGVVVAGFDTELFGHWWHEGPQWLEAVLMLLPEAGIHVDTLAGALRRHDVAGQVHPAEGSWGSGKDFGVWSSPVTQHLRDRYDESIHAVSVLLAKSWSDRGRLARDEVHDQVVMSLLLGMSSDWVFLIEKNGAAEYARGRAEEHLKDVDSLLHLMEQRLQGIPLSLENLNLLQHIQSRDRVWGHVDARTFA